jgi:hypothetical protein
MGAGGDATIFFDEGLRGRAVRERLMRSRAIPFVSFGGTVPVALLPLLGLCMAGLFAELLLQRDAYESLEYGFSLLAVACCGGYLFAFVHQRYRASASLYLLFETVRLAVSFAEGGPVKGEKWPLLVALLFGAIPALFSGLGGWVEA